MLQAHRLGWSVLLLGGSSGVGKSTAAAQLGVRLGCPWLQVDDLRLALQWSRVRLPAGTEALYFFDETPDVWRLAPERLRDGLIAVGAVMSPAIEKVVDNHVHQSLDDLAPPIVIEGDGILPSLLTRPVVQEHAAEGQVRLTIVVEPDEERLLANMLTRGPRGGERAGADVRARARTAWLYGRWLAAEARRYGLPVLESRPWATLADRILEASRAPAG